MITYMSLKSKTIPSQRGQRLPFHLVAEARCYARRETLWALKGQTPGSAPTFCHADGAPTTSLGTFLIRGGQGGEVLFRLGGEDAVGVEVDEVGEDVSCFGKSPVLDGLVGFGLVEAQFQAG